MKKACKYALTGTLALSVLLSGCSLVKSNKQEKGEPTVTKIESTLDIQKVSVNEKIHVNQIGYRPKDKKLFIVNGKDGSFSVVDEQNSAVVLNGEVSNKILDDASGDTLYYGDFTQLKKPGRYTIVMEGYGKSYSFYIGDSVYKDVKNAMLKSFYYQRCGMDLEKQYAGQWGHKACHISEGYLYEDEKTLLEANGGWHDAGDYGKYVVPGVKAVVDLMLAYEFFPQSFNEPVNIPESGNGVPDILNEVRYELEWMQKMQDRKTGAVYHKLTTAGFPGLDTMPEADMGDLVFSPVSSTATADFAAAMAMAARVYKPFDSDFSKLCLNAAENSWKWLMEHKEPQAFKNPEDITTGEYGDESDKDERFWAAVELFRTTGNGQYHQYAISEFQAVLGKGGFGWADNSGYAYASYLFLDKDKIDAKLYEAIKNKFIALADRIVEECGGDGYKVSLGMDKYVWGSNMIALNAAQLLIIANLIDPDEAYIDCANDQFQYILGRNALDICYVTGFGSKSVKHPHHRPSVADGIIEPVPGLIAGGPNEELQDSTAKADLKGVLPARCYIDNADSYSTNETAIYWNSPGVFVAGFFDQDK